MSIQDADPATMDPREFARLVKRAPVDELARLMRGERRAAILDGVFVRMPDVFRRDRARAMSAVIHWGIGDRPDGGVDTYELVITDGVCALSEKPSNEPKVALTIGAVDFLKLVTGNANPLVLFMKGRMTAKGDLGLTRKIPSLFDAPAP
jgi:hypothetical protein